MTYAVEFSRALLISEGYPWGNPRPVTPLTGAEVLVAVVGPIPDSGEGKINNCDGTFATKLK